MYRGILELMLSCGPRLVYGTGMPDKAKDASPGIHFESCVNEKAAYEMALAGAYASKRTACLFSVEGVYEALDPLMSSAYTGVKGGFVVVCVKEGALDVTPLGPFSKLPVLVSDGTPDDLAAALSFAFDVSERYEMPCLLETLPAEGTFPEGGRECCSRALRFREGPGPLGRYTAVQVQAPQGAQREDREDPQRVRDLSGECAGPEGPQRRRHAPGLRRMRCRRTRACSPSARSFPCPRGWSRRSSTAWKRLPSSKGPTLPSRCRCEGRSAWTEGCGGREAIVSSPHSGSAGRALRPCRRERQARTCLRDKHGPRHGKRRTEEDTCHHGRERLSPFGPSRLRQHPLQRVAITSSP